jgi:membrane associated rhomboid family serine protease
VIKRFTPIFTLVALCWLVFVFNNLLWSGHLNQYGIVPRHLGSLPGILWAPFLHGSLKHLVANTVPLFILGAILCSRSRTEFAIITLAGTLLGGGLTWVIARNACHIGASGLVFCFFGYLASLAFFRRTLGALAGSVLCVLGYGGILKGILPTATAVSWESHLAGIASGIALAWMAAKLNPPHKDLEIKPPGLVASIKVSPNWRWRL